MRQTFRESVGVGEPGDRFLLVRTSRECQRLDAEYRERVAREEERLKAAQRTEWECASGHPLDGTKTVGGRRVRYCLTCHRENMRAARAAKEGT